MAASPRRVIVTRPAQEAGRWVDALRRAGFDAVALPLIGIDALEDDRALVQARQCTDEFAALMFVSAAAVTHFFVPSMALPAGQRFWSTGPGTARALRQAGVPESAIDMPHEAAGRFDSESLWACVRDQVHAGTRVLIVRGGDAAGRATGRDWLARTIESAGGVVQAVVAYRRLAPVLDHAQRRLAADGASGRDLWLFSSSEAVTHLVDAMPGQAWSAGRALATHERIADAARIAGFGLVRCCAPDLDALAASIESFA